MQAPGGACGGRQWLECVIGCAGLGSALPALVPCMSVLLRCIARLTVMSHATVWPPTFAWHQRNYGQTRHVIQMFLNSVQDQHVLISKPM